VRQSVIVSDVKMAPKMTKNQMRRAKKKEQKKAQVCPKALYYAEHITDGNIGRINS
jgi:uncharacterized protein YhaN